MKNVKLDKFLKKLKLIVYFRDKCFLSTADIAYIMNEEKDHIDLYYSYLSSLSYNQKIKEEKQYDKEY